MMVSPLTYILKLPQEEIDQYKQNLNSYYASQIIESKQNSGETLTEAEIAEINSGDYLQNSRYHELVIAKQEKLFNMQFLGINLGDIANENRGNFLLYIIPILCMGITFISLRMSSKTLDEAKKKENIKANNDEKGMTTANEEMPMPDMRVMNTMMPIMTGYIAFIAPQGLGLYWTTNSLLQLIQMRVLKKMKDKKKDNK